MKRSEHTNGKTKLTLESFTFPAYGDMVADINKKLGKRPSLPKDLIQGSWTEQSLKVLGERYLRKNDNGDIIETPEELCWRVSWDIASAEVRWGGKKEDIIKSAKEFYNLLVTHEFLPNSPTLMNAGTGNGLQYSACFVLPVEDSLVGIFDAIKYQALIHQTGGGTGFAFSRLRPHGAVVKSSKGTASGPVSFMRIFDAATNEIKQGGKRRGANMGILRVDHPDILEFIHCKEEGGITNFNISVTVTDAFMEVYEKDSDYDLINPKNGEVVGKLNARKVFDEIAEGAWRTGDPGLVFIDRVNAGTANPVPFLGPVESTNPCVTGDTLISTDRGLVRIENLLGKRNSTKLLTDSRLSDIKFQIPTKVIRTGEKQTYRLITKEGYEIRLTGDHRVLTQRGWVEALNLKIGDKLYISDRKGGFGTEGSLEEGQIIGWLVGDGTMKRTQAVLSFFGYEKQELAPRFAQMVSQLVDGKQLLARNYSISVIDIKDRDEARVQSTRLARYMNEIGISEHSKLKVPEIVYQGSESIQRGFLQALFTADGHVEGNAEKGVSVRLTSISTSLLKDVQRILLNFGIVSKIYTERRKEQKRLLPDGYGGLKEYLCRSYSDLVISKSSLKDFCENISFLSVAKNIKLKSLLNKYKEGPYKQNYFARFKELVKEGVEVVYDLTEPSTSSFIANGLVIHNCGEQPLYPYDSCNLGSIFLTYFFKNSKGKNGQAKTKQVDWEKLKKVTRLSVRFLDNVIEMNPYPLDEIRQVSLAIRRIGLGVGGWADMLIDLGIPYDSEEALELGEEIMRVIQEESDKESKRLAKKRGVFPLFPVSIYKDGEPRRNSTVTTIAPTGSISIIAGASSGIEPIFAIAFQHIVKDKHLDRTLTFFNPKFEEIAGERGILTDEIKKKVAEHGVIRDIEEIPEDLRKIFGTAHEIHHDWHIRHQAVFQKYTENAVSKTINMANSVTVDEIKSSYLLAWKTNCKGITVFRDGCKDAQVLNLGVNGKKEKKEEEMVFDKEPLIERPFMVSGATYRMATPLGTAFITINENNSGEPLEVFINVGKAGTDVYAMAHALARTISAALRFRGTLSPTERAKEIASQLAGIAGRRSVGFGPNKILSLPDAVAMAFANHLKLKVNGFVPLTNDMLNNGIEVNGNEKVSEVQSNLAGAVMSAHFPAYAGTPPSGVDDHTAASAESHLTSDGEQLSDQLTLTAVLNTAKIGDICPSCGASSFVYQEGCAKCYACGYSEC